MTAALPPGRVSWSDLRVALLAEFERTRDPRWIQVTPGMLRTWKWRGELSSGPGYDPVELTRYLDRRFSGGRPLEQVS